MTIYVVLQGYYEDTEIELVTSNLDLALQKYVEDTSSVIEVWEDNKFLFMYGMNANDDRVVIEKIMSDMQFMYKHDGNMPKN